MNQFKTNKPVEESGLIESSQTGVHTQLERSVQKHLDTPWGQPLHYPSVDVYRQLVKTGALSKSRPLILDSGCGTGRSTLGIASLYPRHLVLGVDRSQVRLGRSGVTSSMSRNGNCILLRAELTTFWRLLVADRHTLDRHFILYPNPWPKPGHLARRWHGHPVFPELLSLGGEIELRCNWEIYALEFAQATQIATGSAISTERIWPESGISPFEKKYLERGHPLFSVLVPVKATTAFAAVRMPG